jgi:hypothetical protein
MEQNKGRPLYFIRTVPCQRFHKTGLPKEVFCRWFIAWQWGKKRRQRHNALPPFHESIRIVKGVQHSWQHLGTPSSREE